MASADGRERSRSPPKHDPKGCIDLETSTVIDSDNDDDREDPSLDFDSQIDPVRLPGCDPDLERMIIDFVADRMARSLGLGDSHKIADEVLRMRREHADAAAALKAEAVSAVSQ